MRPTSPAFKSWWRTVNSPYPFLLLLHAGDKTVASITAIRAGRWLSTRPTQAFLLQQHALYELTWHGMRNLLPGVQPFWPVWTHSCVLRPFRSTKQAWNCLHVFTLFEFFYYWPCWWHNRRHCWVFVYVISLDMQSIICGKLIHTSPEFRIVWAILSGYCIARKHYIHTRILDISACPVVTRFKYGALNSYTKCSTGGINRCMWTVPSRIIRVAGILKIFINKILQSI